MKWGDARQTQRLSFLWDMKAWHEDSIHPYREDYFGLRNKTAFALAS